MRGPGGGGRTVLSQSEDQSRVHSVFIFVHPMSTQVRSLDLDTTEGGSCSDPQIATRAQNRASRQAAGYPKHCIRPPGSMSREHDRRPIGRANVTKGRGFPSRSQSRPIHALITVARMGQNRIRGVGYSQTCRPSTPAAPAEAISAPSGAGCSLTRLGAGLLPGALRLNAPSGAGCSLTRC